MAQAPDGLRVALDSHYVIHWSDFICGEYDPAEKGLKQAAHEGVERLLELQMNGRLTVGISARFRADKIQDSDSARKARHLTSLELLLHRGAELLSSTFRFDVGWGAFATDEDRALEKELIGILLPHGLTTPMQGHWLNEIADIDHLRDAIGAKCNVFLTEDKRNLKRAATIARLGTRVATLSEFLDGFDVVSGCSASEGHTQDAECEHA